MRRYVKMPNGERIEIESVWTPRTGWVPTGTHVCGLSPNGLTEEARAELYEFAAYLKSGGKRAHGSFDAWRAKSLTSHPSEGDAR